MPTASRAECASNSPLIPFPPVSLRSRGLPVRVRTLEVNYHIYHIELLH
jgi:hypothetical protein